MFEEIAREYQIKGLGFDRPRFRAILLVKKNTVLEDFANIRVQIHGVTFAIGRIVYEFTISASQIKYRRPFGNPFYEKVIYQDFPDGVAILFQSGKSNLINLIQVCFHLLRR